MLVRSCYSGSRSGQAVAYLKRMGYTNAKNIGVEAVPPLLEKPQSDRRYQKYPKTIVPRAESLKQASARIIPYWVDQVAPKVLQGKAQLIVAHGSTLRALIKYLEAISDTGIDGVEVANAAPIIYELDEKLQIISKTTL